MWGFNCPSVPPVFQVEEASRRTSPLSKSCGCVFSAIVSLISQPGVMLFKDSISAEGDRPPLKGRAKSGSAQAHDWPQRLKM
jgi:hypothetical protein